MFFFILYGFHTYKFRVVGEYLFTAYFSPCVILLHPCYGCDEQDGKQGITNNEYYFMEEKRSIEFVLAMDVEVVLSSTKPVSSHFNTHSIL